MHLRALLGPLCRLTIAQGHREHLRLLSRCPDHRILGVGQTTGRRGRSEEGRGAMALSLDAAAEVFREAMRDTVKRYALWYLIQGVLLIAP